ncbi:MAG: WbqC family protein [Bacteroidales bacterium]|nr:WbqC family protein [Bacteroidales bacterium]
MGEEVLLSTAYFPPAEYFSLVAHSRRVIIEEHENYLKQTYRNRCMILGANGPLALIVPVMRGSFHKTALKELKIDNGKRWRELHLRGSPLHTLPLPTSNTIMMSSATSSPGPSPIFWTSTPRLLRLSAILPD